MSIAQEDQKLFDTMMAEATKLGGDLAEVVVTGSPPPWEATWFGKVHANVIDVAGVSYRAKYPDASDRLIANLQVRVKDGFEARIREMAGTPFPLGGGGRA